VEIAHLNGIVDGRSTVLAVDVFGNAVLVEDGAMNLIADFNLLVRMSVAASGAGRAATYQLVSGNKPGAEGRLSTSWKRNAELL
jgi:hypothetical protein